VYRPRYNATLAGAAHSGGTSVEQTIDGGYEAERHQQHEFMMNGASRSG